jgi:hypothetical protein
VPIPDEPIDRQELMHDLRHGKTFRRTRKKYGKKKAQKQMVAIMLSHERKYGRLKPRKRHPRKAQKRLRKVQKKLRR